MVVTPFPIVGRVFPSFPMLVTVVADQLGTKILPIAANAMRHHRAIFGGMANYRVTPDIFIGVGFTAEVTFRNGYVETEHGFPTQAGALDWVGERLVVDQDPAREAWPQLSVSLPPKSNSIRLADGRYTQWAGTGCLWRASTPFVTPHETN
jgi:hypothetical protein